MAERQKPIPTFVDIGKQVSKLSAEKIALKSELSELRAQAKVVVDAINLIQEDANYEALCDVCHRVADEALASIAPLIQENNLKT